MLKKISDSKILDLVSSLPNQSTLLNEASFGLNYIEQYINELQDNASILEIGSGPCILLSHLSASFKSKTFAGIEPIGSGFEKYRVIRDRLSNNFKFDLYNKSYEEFSEKNPTKYDLIFMVNVLEHLPNWRTFIIFIKLHLKESGKCVILCPNYSFPYESHFQIPIIFNKAVTYRLFKRRIAKVESNNGATGLWLSLNFVKLREVQKFATSNNLKLTRNDLITTELIQRLSYDSEFRKRQSVVGGLAKFFNFFGVFALFRTFPFYLFQPYMHLVITHK